ncbi:MAG: hypothetical protein E6614_26870 [Bradyrhizobium sp.]|jgi:hypothetical protein|uniref:Uncharacterized protein n=1 Tax=Bradyrhizobium denitrificans TaxID=2734912 RepID=A0ABS5G525_9BRAD|nr:MULTISPECIES: hypothetical protein [Bradyrhizobium]MBR1136149.1 hypothetical protein [Bradyrhizobium denitrificans]MDU1495827.1 hypothetical protein [Bradyrhizobium sp.]MDU1545978.1 hypothetical protein [Bradyrhizobium sp.]MDU1668952.1 hypothetical protein [Bradyrhizobium sp.]MDU1694338.1 hypothetical protein [Bradyrhizobium sp.]
MTKFDKPQKGNPHQLAINQHTFPARSIARFADASGRIQLQMKADGSVRLAKPTDSIFCARRLWDHAAETLFCKRIEDDFQRLAGLVVGGLVTRFSQQMTHVISSFYALWLARAQIREQPEQDQVMPGIWPDEARTKDQEERLEKNGYAFSRGNVFPARMINGAAIRTLVGRHLRQINPTADWGMIHASGGEFVVPDWPFDHAFVPVSPTLALVNNSAHQRLDRAAMGLLNEQLRRASRRYFFARNFASCP